MTHGHARVIRTPNGQVVVEHADDVIGVDPDLLVNGEAWMFGPDGLLRLDPAGTYRYRPTQFEGRTLLMERVR
jgi:hypothetical protein